MSESSSVDTVIFDVDGTLVDSNYHHTLAWYRAFRRCNVTVPMWRIHRAIGMGGDRLIAAVAGDDVEQTHGDALREAWSELFEPDLAEIAPFADALELLREVKARGLKLVLASSGQRAHVEHYLDLLDADRLADVWTTSEDAESSKPAPDLVAVALEKVGGGTAVMIGDSTWDAIAAAKLDIRTFAVRTGGFSVEELVDAGAVKVYDSLADLQGDLDVITTGDE